MVNEDTGSNVRIEGSCRVELGLNEVVGSIDRYRQSVSSCRFAFILFPGIMLVLWAWDTDASISLYPSASLSCFSIHIFVFIWVGPGPSSAQMAPGASLARSHSAAQF
ncbi:hypothetical protein BT96DRAFT_301095 [Gymnopus androsaceus JB14]|uniref:Uncharacterized protein n=1 Tax=Gymnopus androsaceus JB14 TaxID=1447944 RepID=A0A6A4H2S8_9AGAR|nr:hypothetical protein BT96DRAFT_301095 [Gymnopus androsaceus JB14]